MNEQELSEALATPFRRNKYICDHIYVAYSPSIDIFKIGITHNPKARISSIRSSGLGGVKDWEYHCVYKVGKEVAFKKETEISRLLYSQNIRLDYLSKTSAEYCKELYDCHIKIIKSAFKSIDIIIPLNSEVLRKRFVEFVPNTNFLSWVNLNRKNVGLDPITLLELRSSSFYVIPKGANFS